MVKKLKDIVKKNPVANATFGTDPSNPWATKYNVTEATEAELLARYLSSRGINPKFVPKDTKIAHAKSSEYAKWKNDHKERFAREEVQLQEADKVDTITVDIPLMIRLLEYAREDAKTDMDLHKVTENLIDIRGKGVLSMADYEYIVSTKKKVKEEAEQLDELSPATMASYVLKTSGKDPKRAEPRKKVMSKLAKVMAKQPVDPKSPRYSTNIVGEEKKMTALDKFRKAAAEREKKHAEIEKKQSKDGSGMTAAIDRLEKHLNKEEVGQIAEDNLGDIAKKHGMEFKRTTYGATMKHPKKGEISINRYGEWHHYPAGSNSSKAHGDSTDKFSSLQKHLSTIKEDAYQDTYAATQMPFDGANTTNDTSVKREMSKSARIIKSIYKRKNMKEEMADWEKEDKSVQTYGKKPKLDMTDKKSNIGENKPEARAVMTGGKTLTGQDRDMVEIDPSMKNRPDRPDTFDKGYPKKSPA